MRRRGFLGMLAGLPLAFALKGKTEPEPMEQDGAPRATTPNLPNGGYWIVGALDSNSVTPTFTDATNTYIYSNGRFEPV